MTLKLFSARHTFVGEATRLMIIFQVFKRGVYLYVSSIVYFAWNCLLFIFLMRNNV